jgi:1-acyl-sn-glycerol-3-phosphate acyltransferase
LVRLLRSIGRSIKLSALLLYGALQLLVRRPNTRVQRAQWLHQLCATSMRVMGVTIRCQGAFPERGVVISNHLGYLDIVAFATLQPCVFVSKLEIRSWPFLGWMTTMAGTVYVDRGHGGSAQRAKGRMQAIEDAGLPIVFFPEGTTSDGSTVLKFHSGLLDQALQAGQPVTAAFITYRLTQANGPGVTAVSHLGYWDDTPLVLHIFRMLALRGIELDVRFAESPIVFSAQPGQRKQAAVEARVAVMELGGMHDAVSP